MILTKRFSVCVCIVFGPSWPFELFHWIFCLILHCLWITNCDRYTSDYAHFTFSDTIWPHSLDGSGGLILWYDLRLWHMHIIRSERLNTDSLWDSADQCNWNAEDFLVFHVFFAPIQFGHIPLVFATFRPFEQKTQTNLTLGATYRSHGRRWWWYLYIYDEFDDEN